MLATALHAGASAQSFSFRTVALSGAPAPGTDEFFDSVDHALIGAADGAVIRSLLTGPGPTGPCYEPFGDPSPQQGLWSEASGELQLVAARGLHAAGMDAGIVFEWMGSPAVNASGRLAFIGGVMGPLEGGECIAAGTSGIWSDGAGILERVALSGTPAPGTPAGAEFSTFSNLRLNDAGTVAFSASLSGESVDLDNDRGVWAGISRRLELIVRSDDQAPGTAAGTVFDWFGSGSPQLNGTGQVAFRAHLRGAGVSEANAYGLWAERDGPLELVVRGGDPAPGTDPGVVFEWLGPPAFNGEARTAFRATVAGPGVTALNNLGIWLGIWSEGGGEMELVARTGSSAPGTAAIFTDLNDPVLNENADVAFRGFTASGSGIWSSGSGALGLVARAGDPAPGAGAGVAFAGFAHPALSSAGRIAFWAVIGGPGVDGSNDTGIWAEDASGDLQLVVREGDPIEVAPGDVRMLSHLTFVSGTDGADGRRSGFNADGDVAFTASLTDGASAGFVASPCPAGDVDGDCSVGIVDLLAVLTSWGVCEGCAADLDGDGLVGVVDLLIVLSSWT